MSGPTSNATKVNTAQAVVELQGSFIVVCTLVGPYLGVLRPLGTEEANPLQNQGMFFEERRAGTLMREFWLVNGTLVRWRCSLYPTAAVPPNRSLS